MGVSSIEDVGRRYANDKKSFSVIAPCSERTMLKVYHGTHRFHYKLGTSTGSQILHRCLAYNVFIPENSMIIIDENLIHAGTKSMIAGYAPSHSPRFFTYLHHKDRPIVSDFSYHHFTMCEENCKFCNDDGVKNIVDELNLNFGILESDGVALRGRYRSNDWIAGDMVSLGWVIVRNGVNVERNIVNHVGHDLQTLLLTSKFLKAKPHSSWVTIDSNHGDRDEVIPGSFRSYNYESKTDLRRSACLMYGKRKMVPYLSAVGASHV